MKSNNNNHSATIFKLYSGIESTANAGIIVCALLVIAFCAWTLDRGFEITDEAYYLLMAMHPKSVKLYISAQQWITGGIWQLTGTLASFRAAGLILLVTSASLLALGAMTALSQSNLKLSKHIAGSSVVLASSIICALVYAETINLSPCYNLLAASSAYAAAGLTLCALHTPFKWRQFGLLLLAGGALSIEFVNKPSSGIATLCLISIWICIYNKSLSEKAKNITITTLALVLFTLFLAATQTTIDDAKSSINSGLELFRMVQVEPVGVRLVRYVSEFAGHFIGALKSHVILIIAVALYLWTRRPVFIGVTCLFIAYTLVTGHYFVAHDDQFVVQMQSALVLFLSGLLVSISAWKNNRSFIALIVGLGCLPYTVAVGTGNSIFTQVIVSLAPWGAALAVIAILHFDRKADKIMVITLLIGLLLPISLQIISSGFRTPYHMVKPLSEQSHQVLIEGLGTVKVDSETSKFIGDLNNATKTCNISPGTPYLGLYNIPGVSLVLQTVPVSTPWLNNLAQADAVLENLSLGTIRSSIVAIRLNADGSTPSLPKILGLFPGGFQFCGVATYPFENQKVQIWRSNAN
jgi:hypothetical protein